MKNGIYLCKVKGLKYCDYAVLIYCDNYWWRYFQDFTHDLEGWVGNNLEILEYTLIEGE